MFHETGEFQLDPALHVDYRRPKGHLSLRVAEMVKTGSSAEQNRFPRRILLTATALVCAGLFLSALHTYYTLTNLREEYLSNRARDIAESLLSAIRGPGRRNNPAVWDTELAARIEQSGAQLRYLALLDSTGQLLAEACGDPLLLPAVRDAAPGYLENIYLFEYRPSQGRGPRWMNHRTATPGMRLRIGIEDSDADFLVRQGYVHLVIALAAIALLMGVSFSLLKVIDRHLSLAAREESERHFKTLGKMSATLAHEIRNPLGAMKGLTQVVQEELTKDHATQTMMRTVVGEAERLEKLVSDLLDFARPKELKLTQVNLRELIQSVAELLEAQAEAGGIELRTEISAPETVIESDEGALKQVLYNLILNGIEASGEGEKNNRSIEISLRGGGKTGEIELSVCDRGPGIGEEDPEELFQPFRTTKMTGSGLGLPVSRQLVERLGGTIQLSNRSGGGACCKVKLG
ncbi:MAG: HAMP domain-containing histidine kinase [Acidobacteriota bacterium]|nr:MAG: HAMP domain-containing histidine kinase [Acidobacteriota bacterium]